MKFTTKTKGLLIITMMMLCMSMVSLKVEAAKPKLSAKKITMNVGETKTITLKKKKKKITKVKWKTSNKNVASVSKGKIKANQAGNAVITATYKKKKYSCKVTVVDNNSSTETTTEQNNKNNNNNNTTEQNNTVTHNYAISQTTASIEIEKTVTLSVTDNGSAVSGVTWVSSDSAIAAVADGLVTAVAEGQATITATVDGNVLTCAVTVTIPNYTMSDSKISLTTSDTNTKQLSLKNGAENVSGVEWSTSNEDVATVSEDGLVTAVSDGSAKITAKKYGKEWSCDVMVEGFVFSRDVTIEYGYKSIYVNFDVIEGEEDLLKEQGFTVENGKASKTTECETVKYTFTKLPKTLAEIKSFFADAEKGDTLAEGQSGNYGGFNAMAATICATNVDTWKANPADPSYSKHPVRDMFEYINGPSMTIAPVALNTGIDSMKAAVQACGENVYKAYFNGATPDNNYTPGNPYVLEMYKGPYYIPEKQTINGKRPTTYMILIKSAGFDTDRYIDVYYSTKDKRWYSYENQFQHITANDFKKPETEF